MEREVHRNQAGLFDGGVTSEAKQETSCGSSSRFIPIMARRMDRGQLPALWSRNTVGFRLAYGINEVSVRGGVFDIEEPPREARTYVGRPVAKREYISIRLAADTEGK